MPGKGEDPTTCFSNGLDSFAVLRITEHTPTISSLYEKLPRKTLFKARKSLESQSTKNWLRSPFEFCHEEAIALMNVRVESLALC
jgi:hypothetical protein